MAETEQIDRSEQVRADAARSESGRGHAESPVSNGLQSPVRASGSPLPVGAGGRALQTHGHSQPLKPPPGRALNGPARREDEHSMGMQWALGALKQAVPFVQRLLPLIDGNIATAMANLLSPHPHSSQPAPKVDLAPIETGLAELQVQHSDLRAQVQEQNSSLKKVEDQLQMVREATDRNTLEQQELIEDLKSVANKVNLFALLVLGLLIVSLSLNLFLFLHIQRVLP